MKTNIKLSAVFCLIACLFHANKAPAAEIQWNAVDLDGSKIVNATIDVISNGVIVVTGAAQNGNGLNVLAFDSSRFQGVDASVTLRFRALGREETSLFNILADSDQVISVVLPKVFGAPSTNCPPNCNVRPKWFRRCR